MNNRIKIDIGCLYSHSDESFDVKSDLESIGVCNSLMSYDLPVNDFRSMDINFFHRIQYVQIDLESLLSALF